MAEKLLPYDRAIVPQETGWNCGPAAVQIVLNGLGLRVDEPVLARELGTHTGGTDHIGQITRVLRARTGLDYGTVEVPNDPPTDAQRARLWRDITETIEAGRGMVVNWVAPPSNYPRAVAPSTISPAYSGGTVYHYVALMGYSDEGTRRVWIADSGFRPYGYWLSFSQLCTLIPPKGYAAAPGPAITPPTPAPPVRGGMTAEVLAKAMGHALPLARYEQLLPAFTAAMRAADITTVPRAAQWCAQIGHESGGLKWMSELWGPTTQQLKYDPASGTQLARDLGNTQRGDGSRFRGRGALMVTGRGHYANCSRWAHARGLVPSATFFVDQPEQMASDQYGFVGAVWYWTVERPQLNRLADAGDLNGVTKAINGGLTNIDDRRARYQRCIALGEQLLPPSEEDAMLTPEQDAMLRRVHHELTHEFQSRYVDPKTGEQSGYTDTAIGYSLQNDASGVRTEVAVAALHDAVDSLTSIVQTLAAKIGDKK